MEATIRVNNFGMTRSRMRCTGLSVQEWQRSCGHTHPSRITRWVKRHRGLIAIYVIGAVVVLLQLRSIL